MSLPSNSHSFRTKSARGTSSDPASLPQREINFHQISSSISDSYTDLEEVNNSNKANKKDKSNIPEQKEEAEDPKIRLLLHAENSYLLFEGVKESSKMMEQRLKAAIGRQKLLENLETEKKKLLREKWNILSQEMEKYLDTPCDYLSQTVTAAAKTTKIYSDVLDSLKSEIRMLSNNYKSSADPQNKGQTHAMFDMAAAVQGSPSTESKPAFLSSTKRSQTDYSGDLSSLQATIKQGGKLEFSKQFPPSMHHVAQSLQYTTKLNTALERCLKVGSTNTEKNTPVEKTMESLQEIVKSCLQDQENRNLDDQKIAAEIDDHCNVLIEFQSLLQDDEISESSDGESETSDVSEELSVHPQLVHPHTGRLSEPAKDIMKRMANTELVSAKLPSSARQNEFPLLLSPSSLEEKSSSGIGNDPRLTVDEMIDQLVDVREPNIVKITSIFLRGYRYIMTADALLEKLIYRYCAVPTYDVPYLESYKAHQLSTRLRAVVFIKYWLTNYSTCDFTNPKILHTLKHFIEDIVLFTGYHSIGKQLKKLIEKCESQTLDLPSPRDDEPNTDDAQLYVKPLINMVPVRQNVRERRKKKRGSRNVSRSLLKEQTETTPTSGTPSSEITVTPQIQISLLDYDPKIFAEQLTVFEFAQFKSIPEIELLQQRYSKDRAPHITRNSSHFNQLGGWILLQIFTATDLNTRVRVLRHALSVCIYLYQLNNYNGVISIIAALNNSSVDRLRITWNTAGRNIYILKEAFANITRDNYSRYRKELQAISPPCIPFIGMFLTDLTYLEDGNPNFLEDGSINFAGKFSKISASVSQLLGYQDFHYPIELDSDFRVMFQRLKVISEDESYSLSENLEPRKLTMKVSKFAKLDDDENTYALEILRNIKSKVITAIDDIAPFESEEDDNRKNIRRASIIRREKKT